MATRFKLESAGTPAVSPAIQAAWTHTPASIPRFPMNVTGAGSAFATTSYSPDAADHLVVGGALLAQFVSPQLDGAQTISAQTVSITALVAETNAGNNLFMAWALYVFSGDGSTLRGTVMALRNDGTEAAITQTARTDSATSTSVSAQDGDRIVLELGLAGTPVGAGGVQGHNGSVRLGTAGSDLAANDTATADGNPWVDFATSTMVFKSAGPTFVPWMQDIF